MEKRRDISAQADMEGRATDVPLAQKYNELTEEAKHFVKEKSEKMQKVMPFCECGMTEKRRRF